VLFQRFNDHPHAHQHRLECLNDRENPAGNTLEVHPSLLTPDVEIGMILFAERESKCRDVMIPAKMILLKVLRASAETLFGTIWTSIGQSLFHAAPPEKKR
jgi:hypothetical protein